MILINPNYLFNHVIFINPDKKFILIETDVYRRLHSIIFKGRHSTPKQRRKLRLLFYETYYDYHFNGARIDHQSFNNKILDIYRNDSVISFDHTTQVENQLGEALVDNDLPYYVPEEISVGEEKVFEEVSEVRDSLVKMSEMESGYMSDLTDHMNMQVIKSRDYQLLVDFLGYGKIKNMFGRFIYSKEYRIHDEYEFYFIKSSLNFLAKYRLQFLDRKFDFICRGCLNIGTHYINAFVERKTTSQKIDSCWETYWFNRNGIIKEQVHSDHLAEQFNDKMFFDNGKLVVLSYRTYLQIGLYHADKSSVHDYEQIVIMNNNKKLREELECDINNRMAQHSKLKRGIFPFLVHISDLVEKQNHLRSFLDSYDSLQYSKYCNDVLNCYLEIEAKVDSIPTFDFGVSSSNSSFLDIASKLKRR